MNKGELSILMVDDDAEDLVLIEGVLREALKGISLKVETASSHEEGVAKLEQGRYDVLLVDYGLGEKTGLELMKEMRGNGIDTPVVFLTGCGDEQIAVEAMKLGASDYLPKSKLSETLVRTSVRYAIELHEREKLRQAREDDLQLMNRELQNWVKELERRSREGRLLNELGGALQTCINLDEAYALIAQRIAEFFPGRSGALCMFDASRTVIAVGTWGAGPPEKREFTSDDCWALRRARLYSVHDPHAEIVCPHLEGSTWKSHFCAPLMAYGEALGVLIQEGSAATEDKAGNEGLSSFQAECQFVEMLCEHVALALANLRLREALHTQAIHDSLTGLFNRRYMEEFLERAVSSARRHGRPLALLMLDIDHFKPFNDTYGHEAGDTLLKFLGQFLQLHTRGEDIACRYGGDEFVLILPEVPLSVAAQRAEELRAAIKDAEPPLGVRGQPMPSVSTGITAVPEHGFSAQGLLRIADAALYRAKTEGRSQVVIGDVPKLGDLYVARGA